MSIGTVISYCTNDYRFISKCIDEAKKFSETITVVTCDHFFDGTPENRQLLDHTYSKHPDCQFIEFSYLSDRTYSPYHSIKPTDPEWAKFWAATTRYIGYHYTDVEYLLFLDSDEIVSGDRCLQWLGSGAYLSYEVMRLAAYLYAIKPTIRAKKVVNLPLFVKKKSFSPLTLMNDLERIGAFLTHLGPKTERIVGLDHQPFVHHYSWVRTKEECLWKSKTWGHRGEEDWPMIIEAAFQDPKHLIGEYETIDTPFFDPFGRANVLKINDRDLFVLSLPI